MKKQIALIVCTGLMTVSAFAARSDRGQSDRRQGNGQKIEKGHVLSFADIKEACQNPARFHNQSAPTDIQVSCKDTQYKWVADEEKSMALPATRLITASVYSDKYSVSPVTTGLKMEEQMASCPAFKQVSETLETVRAVSCEEIVAYDGTATDFCATAVDELRAANAEAVTVEETGKVVSLCGSDVDQRGQRGQRGQNGGN